jgi:hypothetical protein
MTDQETIDRLKTDLGVANYELKELRAENERLRAHANAIDNWVMNFPIGSYGINSIELSGDVIPENNVCGF